jgi:hypothetical protein
MIEKGDAEVVDGNVILRGSMDPGQQRPPIPRPPSAQDGRRQTLRLDQLSQGSRQHLNIPGNAVDDDLEDEME